MGGSTRDCLVDYDLLYPSEGHDCEDFHAYAVVKSPLPKIAVAPCIHTLRSSRFSPSLPHHLDTNLQSMTGRDGQRSVWHITVVVTVTWRKEITQLPRRRRRRPMGGWGGGVLVPDGGIKAPQAPPQSHNTPQTQESRHKAQNRLNPFIL